MRKLSTLWKSRVIHIILILVVSLSLVACREIESLKSKCVALPQFDIAGIGDYSSSASELSLFFYRFDGYFLKIYDFNSLEIVQYTYAKTGKSFQRDGIFWPSRWNEQYGLIVIERMVTEEEISHRTLRERIAPTIKLLLKQGVHPMQAMRQVAEDIGLIQPQGTKI